MKKKFTPEQIKAIKAEMVKAQKLSAEDRNLLIAKQIGEVYDVEVPIPAMIEAIARVERAEVGEHVYYNVPTSITKTVNTISANCTITQTKISPNSRSELSFTDLVSEEVYVCIHDWLKADHNVLELNATAIMEAMDRQEIYSTLQLIDAGAVSESNTYTLDSGKTKFDWPRS
jgi:uncharacterized protein YbaR (Trm112 family)